MLTCEVPPTSGKIIFEGRDITGMSVTDVCQLGLTKSYQVNQLFTPAHRAREPDDLGAGGTARQIPARSVARAAENSGPRRTGRRHALELVDLARRADVPVSELAYGEKRRLEVGLALASSPSLLCCSTSRSPA